MGYEGLPFEGLPASFHVFPLHTPVEGGCSCRRDDCRNIGKHPRTMNGLSDATNDVEQVREWWRMWTGANVGVACGPSGIVVIDVDPRHGGDEALRDLVQGQEWPDTPTALTGGGGEHYYFRAPEHTVIRNSAGALGPGIDVRGDGGYVVAPPSLHSSGGQYEWQAGYEPGAIKGAVLPSWIVDMLTGESVRDRSTAAPIGDVIPEGQRDQVMTSIAGTMRRRGLSEESILAALQVENAKRCSPPLTNGDLRRIARSVSRYAPAADIPIKTGITTYTNLRRLGVSPAVYRLEVNGQDVTLSSAQLMQAGSVRRQVLEQCNWLPEAMKQTEWDSLLEALVEEIDVLEVNPEASQAGWAWSILADQLPSFASEDEQKFGPRPLEKDGVIHTTRTQMNRILKQHGIVIEGPTLYSLIEAKGGTADKSARINGKVRKTWQIPLEVLQPDEAMTEEDME